MFCFFFAWGKRMCGAVVQYDIAELIGIVLPS